MKGIDEHYDICYELISSHCEDVMALFPYLDNTFTHWSLNLNDWLKQELYQT